MVSLSKTQIKFINQVKQGDPRALDTKHRSVKPQPVSGKAKQRDTPLQDTCDEATYEECKAAFDQLASLHAAAQAETAEAMRRLDRSEQDLRRVREQAAGYATHMAAQERELRAVKEGKQATERLNTKLMTQLESRSGKDGASSKELDRLKAEHRNASEERDRLKAAHRSASEELDRVKAAHRNASDELDRATARAKAYEDMLDHVDRAIGICARACDAHAPETAKDMRETQETLRQFRKARH